MWVRISLLSLKRFKVWTFCSNSFCTYLWNSIREYYSNLSIKSLGCWSILFLSCGIINTFLVLLFWFHQNVISVREPKFALDYHPLFKQQKRLSLLNTSEEVTAFINFFFFDILQQGFYNITVKVFNRHFSGINLTITNWLSCIFASWIKYFWKTAVLCFFANICAKDMKNKIYNSIDMKQTNCGSPDWEI